MSLALTEAAADRIKAQLEERGSGIGLRVGVRKSGCSAYRYTMEFADAVGAEEEVYEGHGARLLVSREHLALIDGSTLDFKEEGLNRMFRFDNPRADNLCGCGESFDVS